ncbi:hypothetical protein AUJ68_06835 [Candidatus Woesearchaeota archaeon CG1_02_57_44]|nr:MAG: hypothetical protein AUJ68_06835 [Candidatus Woesearchaeota archaeon CG1_02_57_44]
MRLTITRHGHTEGNAAGIIQGHSPGKLTDVGKEQARRLGERLASERFDVILTSDLARAQDTAREVAKHHPGTPVVLDMSLRERDFGAWEGEGKNGKDWSAVPPGGESNPQLYARAQALLAKLRKDYASKHVLLVGHSRINVAIMAALRKEGHERLPAKAGYENTSVTIVDLSAGAPRVLVENCTLHLE